MTDVTSAPAGGEGEAAPTISNSMGADAPETITTNQAAKALAELRWQRHKESSAESAKVATAEQELSGEDNAAPAEQAHGEDQSADPVAEPPIERPKSWTESEEAEWRATPRALQQKIAARELERDTALRRTQNDAAERLKGLTAKEQEVEQEKKALQAKLPALMQALHDVTDREFPDIKSIADYERLAMEAHRITVEDPFRALQIGNYLKAFDAHQQKVNAVNVELQKAESDKRSANQAELDAYKNEHDKQLLEFAPELAEPKKKAEIMDKAVKALVDDLGFKRSELDEFANDPMAAKLLFHSAFQKLVYGHLKFSDLKAAPAKAIPIPVPPVQRPGTARLQGTAASERVQALDSKLTNSGSLKDAQALLLAKRTAGRRAS
jgi:hypothetical protein